jgi:hypothetical protein
MTFLVIENVPLVRPLLKIAVGPLVIPSIDVMEIYVFENLL